MMNICSYRLFIYINNDRHSHAIKFNIQKTEGLPSVSCHLRICSEVSYAKAGIKLMEVSPDSDEYADLDYESIGLWAKKYGITLWSFHFQFMPFEDIDISVPSLAEKSVEALKDQMTKANKIGIKLFVIHPSGEPIEESDRRVRIECSKNSLKELAEYADSIGCVIAVEDLPRTCLGRDSADVLELISAHKSLRVCFDTNHLLKEDIIEFVKKTGDKIVTIHASDYDYINERHWLPGEGKIDWQALISALKEVGYDGPWLYELAFAPYWSVERQRDLSCEDFVRNHSELMNNKSLTAVGKARENIGMYPPSRN